jgi:hypothetical protein
MEKVEPPKQPVSKDVRPGRESDFWDRQHMEEYSEKVSNRE